MVDEDGAVRLYGPWRRRTPEDARILLEEYSGSWWVAGGWALEEFTGTSRHHGDLDLSIPRSDVALLRAHLHGVLDVWAADRGTLRPLTGPSITRVPESCENLWLRRSGADPWEYDVILLSVSAGRWVYKRDARIREPLERILWTRGGIRYLRPEVQLLHKAPGLRPKDEADFDAALPVLDAQSRAWLRDALRTAHPGHPWVERL